MGLSKKNNSNIKTLKWIYGRTKKFLPSVAIISVGGMIQALSTVYLALVSKDLLDIATGNIEGSFVRTSIILFAILSVQVFFMAFDSLYITYTSSRLTISFRDYLFRTVSRRKYSDVTKFHSGDILNRFTSDTDVVINSTVSIIPSILSMATKLVGGVYTLIMLDKRIAVIIVGGGILIPAVGRIINKKFKKLHKEAQKTEGQVRSFIQECFENLVVLKTFNGENSLSTKLNQYLRKNFRIKMKRSAISLVTHLSLFLMFSAGYYGVMVWGAGKISTNTITYGTLMAFLQLVQQLRGPMQSISGILPQYYSAIASAERLMEVDSGDYDLPPAEEKKLEEIKNNFSGISFKNISFGYTDELILKDCNFELPAGKITAITGESGSGKSTLFKLILNLYEPQGGEIIINDNILLDASLRGIFAYVPQGNLVLSGTIRENITLCNNSISEERIINAVKIADIYDYIESLPDGLDTVLSERGAGLSEGQIQRISIARALLTDAPILLLDEATSALDEPTETKVLDNIKAMKEKTVLFVTHRNTSLKVCDRIVHVKDKVFSVIKE